MPAAHRTTAIAANLELMFGEAGERIGDRVRAAAAAGIREVEIWGWRAKDLDEFGAALQETGVQLRSLIVDPMLQLTDPATHDAYVDAVRESAAVAVRLGSPNLVTLAGDERLGVPRAEQHAAVVAALTRGAAVLDGTPVRLLLENLNTVVDHRGTYLSSTREGLEIVAEVGSPHLRLLLDAYHAVVMQEDLEEAVGDDIDLVGHVQVADAPGRHEPGTGSIDWAEQLGILRRLGYTGTFGMEYSPVASTVASLVEIERIVAALDGDGA